MRRLAELVFGLAICVLLATACSRGGGAPATLEELKHGAELFAHYCSGCHPDGGNAVYPQKTLYRHDLAANGITTPDGIIAKMRNPDPGMKRFDKETLPKGDALAIARYILVTFK